MELITGYLWSTFNTSNPSAFGAWKNVWTNSLSSHRTPRVLCGWRGESLGGGRNIDLILHEWDQCCEQHCYFQVNAKFLCVGFLVISAVTAVNAALFFHYRMDSYALLSDTIVLCEEKNVEVKEILHERWPEVKTVASCKVDQVFKGDIKPQDEFLIEYSSSYRRHSSNFTVVLDANSKYLGSEDPSNFPAGRALLFLKDGKEKGTFSLVAAKSVFIKRF